MKPSDYIKKVGREFIIRTCNYDLKDISNHLVRETDLEPGSSQLWNVMKPFKKMIKNIVNEAKQSPLIKELLQKLREED